MSVSVTRREALLGTIGAGVAAAAATPSECRAKAPAQKPGDFRFCFNTSTIRGQQLGIVKEVDLVADAGYTGIEPWIREIEAYQKEGGSLKDLRKRIEDAGLTVESAIGFARWILDDPKQRQEGLEQARRDMDLLKQIGGVRIAAPPVGATNEQMTDLLAIAERYGELLKVGADIGVVPQLEVWGFSKTLSRLGESTFVAIEAGHADACLLPDIYHIYKGGSDFVGLELLAGSAIHVFHLNDYPADPPRESIKDEHRVYPGDGVAPIQSVLQTLRKNGCNCAFSLELFNRDYWNQDPAQVARTGLEKMKAVVG